MALLFWVIFMLAMVGLIAAPSQKKIGNAVAFVVMAGMLFILSIFAATYAFGFGKVTAKVEAFSERLDSSVAYQLIYSERQGDSYVLLVKVFGTNDTKAIRTDTVPPEIFTLVNDQPVEVKK